MRDELVERSQRTAWSRRWTVTGRDLVERARGIHTLLPYGQPAGPGGGPLLAASMIGGIC